MRKRSRRAIFLLFLIGFAFGGLTTFVITTFALKGAVIATGRATPSTMSSTKGTGQGEQAPIARTPTATTTPETIAITRAGGTTGRAAAPSLRATWQAPTPGPAVATAASATHRWKPASLFQHGESSDITLGWSAVDCCTDLGPGACGTTRERPQHRTTCTLAYVCVLRMVLSDLAFRFCVSGFARSPTFTCGGVITRERGVSNRPAPQRAIVKNGSLTLELRGSWLLT